VDFFWIQGVLQEIFSSRSEYVPDFRTALSRGRILFFDGAMGTMLQARGLRPGQNPEMFGLHNPGIIEQVHREYLEGGADVLTTNTFGGNRFKLPSGTDPVEVNRVAAAMARSAAGDRGFVAGSVGPTGKMVVPLGRVTFREMVDVFREQIRGLVQGGADLILGETHYDLAEARAVVLAAREECDLPVGISMTFESGVSLTGTTPLTFVDTMQNMGVDLVATNCSAGPEQLLDVVRAMGERLETPLLVEPNAGLPELENGETVFKLAPTPFAEQTARFPELGATCLGGCCGTSPDHIRALRTACADMSPSSPVVDTPPCLVLTSRTRSVPVGFHVPTRIIGERINPTGKKDLIAQLQEGRIDRALELADEQVAAGAAILDVNVGAPMADEQQVLPRLVQSLISRVHTPLCLDTSDEQAMKSALDAYPGSPLVNSISGEAGKMETFGPLCRDYGAPFILLPLKGRRLPVTGAERLAIIEELLEAADRLAIPRRLILVDALALTVSSKPLAARACLEVISECRRRWGLTTTMGLSNISFGLPARELLNGHFLSMSMAAGMGAVIANPNTESIREALLTSEVLLGRDPQAETFINRYSGWIPSRAQGGSAVPVQGEGTDSVSPVHDAVVRGLKEKIVALIRAELDRGREPFELVDQEMIPAITAVGDRYERKEYFLPQLLLSAETMQTGFEVLKPLLEKKGESARVTVVMATVEGDIHDIGKNIVCLMLRNYGFEVVDLGKDVPAKTIVDAVQEHGAPLVGLSALMTTTMTRMEDTVSLLAERNINCKVMVGGAVVTEEFARRIGADGYSRDAVEAVKLAQRLCGLVETR
jgi:5-methyltetrahydrofolate--homocysteine methyltransferase